MVYSTEDKTKAKLKQHFHQRIFFFSQFLMFVKMLVFYKTFQKILLQTLLGQFCPMPWVKGLTIEFLQIG